MSVRVGDLEDQIGAPRPFLKCGKCGGEYSANRGDYFMARPDVVMKCCGVPVKLVTARRVLAEVA